MLDPAVQSLKGSIVRLGSVDLQVAYSPGQAPAIVLVHGGLGNRFNWQNQWEFLQSRDRAVLAYDLAGHGESGRYRRYSVGRHRRDLTRLLHHFSLEQPILCCHSYGVTIGLEWAARHPTTAMIAIAGGTHNLTPWWEVPLMKFFAAGGYQIYHSFPIQQLIQRSPSENSNPSSDLPSHAHPYEAIESFWGYDGRRHALTCPTVVITGGRDPVFPPMMGDQLAAHLSSSVHLTVPASGHSVMVEAPNLVNQALWQLLHRGELVESWVDLVSNGWVTDR